MHKIINLQYRLQQINQKSPKFRVAYWPPQVIMRNEETSPKARKTHTRWI